MQEYEVNSVMPNMSRFEWARFYVSLGWRVLPLHTPDAKGMCSCGKETCSSSGKHPRTKHGCKDATTDADQIAKWWRAWPQANIGIATGSASRLLVIDVDARHGGEASWGGWRQVVDVPETLKAITGGGYHLYFATEGVQKNRTGILPGVDVRGEDGYVVAPGSIHSSQVPYQWLTMPSSEAIAALPKNIEGLLMQDERPARVRLVKDAIPRGERHTVLTSIAGLMRKHGLREHGILTALTGLNRDLCSEPLEGAEVNSIAKSIGKYPTDSEQTITWKEPKELPSPNLKAPALPAHLLPVALRPWVEDICDRMQVPLEFVAAPTIVGLSSIIGRQIAIHPKQKDDWLVLPNLWGAVVARPGFFKTPAMAEAMKPIEMLATKARIKFESEKVAVKAKEEMFKAKIEGLKDTIKKAARKGNSHDIDRYQQDLEKALTELESLQAFEKRFKTNDATIEKLGALLNENPNGLMVFRDELSGWLCSLQKSGHEGNREFYLEAWNGYGSYTVDRIGRGTIHIPALCLSIFGGLQPGKLEGYVNQALSSGAHDDGLLQRMQILVYPDVAKKWKNVDRKPDSIALAVANQVFASMAGICKEGKDDGAIKSVHFARDAQEIFDSWRERLENRLRRGKIDSLLFESHIAKYRSMIPSLALIFHLVEHYKDKDYWSTVSAGCLEMAIAWADFLEKHAVKVYSNALQPGVAAAHALVERINKGEVKDGDSLRSIYRHHWSLLDTLEKLETAIAVLEDAGWVQVEAVRGAAKTTECLRINDAAFNKQVACVS